MTATEIFSSKLDVPRSLLVTPTRIGELLYAADLISVPQIKMALYEQARLYELSLGEIMSSHGWISQKTADFFGDHWSKIISQAQKECLGKYLKWADLIDEDQIKYILKSQEVTGLKFGAAAVVNGYIKQSTIDFFVSQICLNFSQKNHIKLKYVDKKVPSKPLSHSDHQDDLCKQNTLSMPQSNDIAWIG